MTHNGLETSIVERAEDSSLLQFLVDSALQASSWWISQYEINHAVGGDNGRGKLAMGRLQWIIDKGRESLSGQLTVNEFALICSAFTFEVTAPYDFERIVNTVSDEYGVYIDKNKKSSCGAELIEKLRVLTPSESLALLDLVLLAWSP